MFSMNDWKHYNKHSYFLYRSVMRLGPIPEACLPIHSEIGNSTGHQKIVILKRSIKYNYSQTA